MHVIVQTFELYNMQKFSWVAFLETMILVTSKMLFEQQKYTEFFGRVHKQRSIFD